jgi:HPt (histidine-containing phosphotransfer) domain-containing protein
VDPPSKPDIDCAAPDARPSAPLVDLAALARLENDLGRESMSELLELFRAESERRRSRIETGIAAGDSIAAGHEAHALKGSALTFGAGMLSELALIMEHAGRQGDLEGLTRNLPELANVTARTYDALSRVFSDSGE